MNAPTDVVAMAKAAKGAAVHLATLPAPVKNAVLVAAAEALISHSDDIERANDADLEAARAAGWNHALLDRLSLTPARIESMAAGLRHVADREDPVGQIVRGRTLDNGLVMRQVRVPLGVVGVVYEARPNVTVDVFGLTLKSGNAALLRGSKSARQTNEVLTGILQDVVEAHGLPRQTVQLLGCETHETVRDLVTARGFVDVVIPRGSARLIDAVVSSATVPTIETGTGNCHFYIDASASLDSAIAMLLNGKTRRVSVCNATETALLDAALPDPDKLRIVEALQGAGVAVHGDVDKLSAFGARDVIAADEADWAGEYLSMDIAVAVVEGVDGAVEHIARWSTGHTEAIAARDAFALREFAQRVDSAAVMLNASTAFTDGEQFGMGAEIGISTQKLHARGPLGLPELTSTKWILEGTGQTRP
ncbi:Gamma-glutamyl phosphate reductase [Corynebacterium capitovis DSM 44611]|uniref:glutamate-5-semialdehyde dehydrogenase n=1 Tax=Corynebacterium capitovis TaxID=131081 RepID=UPI00035C45AB|nr:glutamate-5-semialdehyde dehydrogenase [Corynebacterium capitovis]WKD57196.1 Gamma-glutamyl phosphate reductase [Corynebacterium capitovis DSM 44611]